MNFCFKQGHTCRLVYATSMILTLATAQGAGAAPVETILYNFGVIPGGHNPQAPLTPAATAFITERPIAAARPGTAPCSN